MLLSLLAIRIRAAGAPAETYRRMAFNMLAVNVVEPHGPDLTRMRMNDGGEYIVKTAAATLEERIREAHDGVRHHGTGNQGG